MITSQIDAYRYFFPAGWLLGLWGVLLWILFPLDIVAYPGLRHPDIMMGGFFLCFVCGFLMTAAPKFTQTFGPTRLEQNLSFVLISSLVLSLLPSSKIYFYFVATLIFIFLFKYLLTRFIKRKSNPPDSFLFVGFGVGTGLIGSCILLLSEFTSIPTNIYLLGRTFFLQTYILCLVLGVGSRLIPALLGWAPLPTDVVKTKPPSRIKLFLSLAILFLLSYVLEIFSDINVSTTLRALIISFLSFKIWKLQKFPARKAIQSWLLWLSAWLVALGHWAIIFFSDYRIHILHVILISGLALMTLMIATRVTLSHGNHDMSVEKKSKLLLIGGLLIAAAGITRLSAGFSPDLYQSHLIYAAHTWICGLVVWGYLIIPKLLKLK